MSEKRFLSIATGLLLWMLTLACSCKAAQINIHTVGFQKSTILKFAQKELTTYMSQAIANGKIQKKYSFQFVRDITFHQGEFACKALSPTSFRLSGENPTSISHAVYTFLEELGYTFDISQTLSPDCFHFERIRSLDKTIVPKVRWRGIRQHVNFPMDISSYPIEEAKEYLNNLIRLRFNKLVVHSYPGMWYEQPQGDSLLYAGNFFYDSPHYYQKNDCLKEKVRFNDSLFCIPNTEKVYFDGPKKSKFAQEWMKELLTYAKSIGLYLQFSFEPRTLPLEETVALAKRIKDTYPMIDALEIMTEETGGWGAGCTRQQVETTLTSYFGQDILKDSLIASSIQETQNDLNNLYAQIGNNCQTIRRLQEDEIFKASGIALKLGIYCSTSYHIPSYHLARKTLPDVPVVVMPSHGSDGVAKAVQRMIRHTTDIATTEIYSWIEFDGLMYQQQNAINGIYQLIENLDNTSGPIQIPSICFNHWRTCENRVTARYASAETLYGTLQPKSFYTSFAERTDIASPDLFAQVMEDINRIDSFSTTSLGNIGFCWTGAWRNSGLFRWMNTTHIDTAIVAYQQIGSQLTKLLKKSPAKNASRILRLLENRVSCSVIYLQAFKVATEIRSVKEENPTAEEKEKSTRICDQALSTFNQYIKTYAQLLPDRGSEGVIVSVWNSPMYGLKLIRHKLAGIPLEENRPSEEPIDSPPLPILY